MGHPRSKCAKIIQSEIQTCRHGSHSKSLFSDWQNDTVTFFEIYFQLLLNCFVNFDGTWFGASRQLVDKNNNPNPIVKIDYLENLFSTFFLMCIVCQFLWSLYGQLAQVMYQKQLKYFWNSCWKIFHDQLGLITFKTYCHSPLQLWHVSPLYACSLNYM